jgi:hypothetical protein
MTRLLTLIALVALVAAITAAVASADVSPITVTKYTDKASVKIYNDSAPTPPPAPPTR